MLDGAPHDAVVPAGEHGVVVEHEDIARRIAVEVTAGVDEPVGQVARVGRLGHIGRGLNQWR